MKKTIITFAFCVIAALFACNSEIKDDAKQTPIGSVISGETTSTESYIERVKQQNRSLDKDTWRPENNERF